MWLTMSLSNVFLSSNITQSQLTQMGNFEYGEDIYIFFLFYNKKKKKDVGIKLDWLEKVNVVITLGLHDHH